MFDYATPQDTPAKMAELMQFYHAETEKNELHAVELAAFIHYKFVCIHPFDDGNGRISRLLMNYILLKNGFPPVVIKSADKKNYLNALNQADTSNLQAFFDYIAKQLVWSLELVLKATKGENIEETNDIYKEIEMFKKQQLPSNMQAELLKLYATGISDENLAEIKEVIAKFLFEKAQDKADKIWEEKKYNQDTFNN